MSPWDTTLEAQPAGLSTAECECPSTNSSLHGSRSGSDMNPSMPRKVEPVESEAVEIISTVGTSVNNDSKTPAGNGGTNAPVVDTSAPTTAPLPSAKSPSPTPPSSPKAQNRGSALKKITSTFRPSTTRKSSSDMNISVRSLTDSAPTILIRTPLDDSGSRHAPPPIRSIMSSRTLHESLHRNSVASASSRRRSLSRAVSFKEVNIREYERILGDNPSVRSGPPLAIGWRYDPNPIKMPVDDFEEGKGLPRSSSEFLVPKAIREKLLKEHADVSRRDIAAAVRQVSHTKSQRRKTVVNLGMAKAEERVEAVKRTLKKVLKARSSYEVEEHRLWDEAHRVAMEKAKKLEESIRKGESCSSQDVYRVGTPMNHVIPSARNLALAFGTEPSNLSDTVDGDIVEISDVGGKSNSHGKLVKAYRPHSKQAASNRSTTPPLANSWGEQQLDESSPRRSSYNCPLHADTDLGVSSSEKSGKNYRRSDSDLSSRKITACESDGDDILANLLLDSSDI